MDDVLGCRGTWYYNSISAAQKELTLIALFAMGARSTLTYDTLRDMLVMLYLILHFKILPLYLRE